MPTQVETKPAARSGHSPIPGSGDDKNKKRQGFDKSQMVNWAAALHDLRAPPNTRLLDADPGPVWTAFDPD
jgi:hypothetical protein